MDITSFYHMKMTGCAYIDSKLEWCGNTEEDPKRCPCTTGMKETVGGQMITSNSAVT